MFRTLGVFAVIIFSACTDSSGTEVQILRDAKAVSPTIRVEVADTDGKRAQGLMYRKQLDDHQGMLFIFPSLEPRSFWMKNTYLELDIIFLDAEKRIVNIVHRAVPLTETPRLSSGPAKYVLEIKGGLAEKWGLAPGDVMAGDG